MLPKNEKVHRDATNSLKIWVYGPPNIGKTTFANQFPDTLMINTDGNYKYVDSPVVTLVTEDGKHPWENFCEIVDEILAGNHTFQTIILDLVEDIYQYARTYYLKKLNIDHEADLGYAKGYDIIRTPFLIALRKLANSKYNIVFISHEDATVVKDRIGTETTVYSPSLSDKIMKKVAGMMEITARISIESVKNEDGSITDTRYLNVGSAKDMFGGNKIPGLKVGKIVLSYENLVKAIKNEGAVLGPVNTPVKEEKKKDDIMVVARKKDK